MNTVGKNNLGKTASYQMNSWERKLLNLNFKNFSTNMPVDSQSKSTKHTRNKSHNFIQTSFQTIPFIEQQREEQMNHHENPRLKKPKVDDLTQRIHKRHTSYRVAPINNFAPIRPDHFVRDDQEIKRPSLNKKLSNMSLNKDLPKEDKVPG